MVIWLMGKSGSGKTTLSQYLRKRYQFGNVVVLDGDDLRSGINEDLDYSSEDRYENLRRAAEIAKIINNQGVYVIYCFITPFKENRNLIKDILEGDVKFIYLKCNQKILEQRDPKGLYKKAMNGEIENFTGVSQNFEEPTENENAITVDTGVYTDTECYHYIIDNFGV